MRVLSGFVDSLALTAEHRLCALSLSNPHRCVQRDLLACSKDRHKSHNQIAQLFGPCFITFYFSYKATNTSQKTCITWLWLAREILAGKFLLGRLKYTYEDMHIKRNLLLVLTNKPRRWNWNSVPSVWVGERSFSSDGSLRMWPSTFPLSWRCLTSQTAELQRDNMHVEFKEGCWTKPKQINKLSEKNPSMMADELRKLLIINKHISENKKNRQGS